MTASLRTGYRVIAPLLGALGLLAGCLALPDGAKAMCRATADCDALHGEVCEEGVCWGNPPGGMFAAVISPPNTRGDLVPLEIARFALPHDGWMGELRLEPPVVFGGRIIAYCPPPMTGCDAVTLGASVKVARRSQFQGGPDFDKIVNVEAGAESFLIPVPVTGEIDDAYTVTIVPESDRRPGAAIQVPPLRTQVRLPQSMPAATFELGGPALPVISGTLTNAFGEGLSDYRVVALGRWDPTESPTEVSTVDITGSDGAYAVTLSDALVGTVELVARPPETPIRVEAAPTVRIANIDATRSSQHDASVPGGVGRPATLTVAVTGFDPSGTLQKVLGASVSVSGVVNRAPASFDVGAVGATDGDGLALLALLDGGEINGSYRLSITPPAGSSLGAVFAHEVSVGPGATVSKRLASRIAVRGTVVDSAGVPLRGVVVTARPSLRFLWALDPAAQAFVAEIPAATTSTFANTGEFLLWVDAGVAGVAGQYDLMVEPPTTTASALTPTYVKTGVAFAPDPTFDTFDLGEIRVPDGAFLHGQLLDPAGLPLENAELKLYLIETQLSLCSDVEHEPVSCPIPAMLQGRNTSDRDGGIRVVVPR